MAGGLLSFQVTPKVEPKSLDVTAVKINDLTELKGEVLDDIKVYPKVEDLGR